VDVVSLSPQSVAPDGIASNAAASGGRIFAPVASEIAHRAQVYSFDVFDTCVTRHCAEPTDLFKALFTRLLSAADAPRHGLENAAIRLARLRIEAEAQARQQAQQSSGADDVALAKIYQTLAPSLAAHGLNVSHAIAEEIEIELAAVSPILSTRLHIQSLRDRGHSIVFISDMYLPGSVVRQMLIEHGFTNGGDRVYVSADVGLSKGSGRLFTHVCQQLGIEPKQMHHTGDNLYADVQSARRQGLVATYFVQGEPTRYEKGFRSELLGDGWLASHLVGLSRAIRLRHDPGSPNSQRHATLAADVLAPLLTGYVAWVLTSAQQIGLERLYFADEGLYAIAQNITRPWQQLSAQDRYRSDRSALDISLYRPLPAYHLLTADGWHGSDDEATEDTAQQANWALVVTGCPVTHEQSELTSRYQQKITFGYHYSLLGATEADPASAPFEYMSLGRSSHHPIHFAYLDAPLASHRALEGVAFLFEYRQILSLMISFTSDDAAYGYRAMALDYAATFGRSRSLKNHLDMLKRYATRNMIAFLCAPHLADVRTLNDLQLANKPSPLLMAWPISLWALPAVSKRLIKGASLSSAQPLTENIRWIEGSLMSSSQLVQLLVRLLRWAYRNFSYRRSSRRDRWFYQRH